MNQIQGKNQIVRELIYKSAYKTFSLYEWYQTRNPETQDIIKGIPVILLVTVFFFFCCFF